MRIGDIIELSEYGKRQIAKLPAGIALDSVGKIVGIERYSVIQVQFDGRDMLTTIKRSFIRQRPHRGGKRKNG